MNYIRGKKSDRHECRGEGRDDQTKVNGLCHEKMKHREVNFRTGIDGDD